MFCSSVKILSLASGAGWPRVFLLFETGEKENLGSYICNVCRRRPGGNLATWTYPRIRERSPPPPPLVLTHNTTVCDVNWWIVKSPKAFRHCLFCAGRTFYLGYHSKRFDICWVYYTLDNNAWLLFFFSSWKSFKWLQRNEMGSTITFLSVCESICVGRKI